MAKRRRKSICVISTDAERDYLDEIERLTKDDPRIFDEITTEYCELPPDKRLPFLGDKIDMLRSAESQNNNNGEW